MESGGSLPPTDLVLQALHAIRKQVEQTHAELQQTNERLGALEDRVTEGFAETNKRFEQTNERLERLENRVTAGFIETNTKLADLTGRVDGLSGRVNTLSGRVDQLGDRLENVFTGPVGKDVRDLKERVRLLEERGGTPGAPESQAPYGDKK